MSNEKKIQLLNLFKLLVIAICAFLYSYGGLEWKPARRFIAPALCGGFLFIVCRDWRVLIKIPLLIGASCLGYGADDTIWKVLKRLYCGFLFGAGAAAYEALKQKWLYVGLSCCLIAMAFILLGVWNPLIARDEEMLLGLLIYSMAIMPVEWKLKGE